MRSTWPVTLGAVPGWPLALALAPGVGALGSWVSGGRGARPGSAGSQHRGFLRGVPGFELPSRFSTGAPRPRRGRAAEDMSRGWGRRLRLDQARRGYRGLPEPPSRTHLVSGPAWEPSR